MRRRASSRPPASIAIASILVPPTSTPMRTAPVLIAGLRRRVVAPVAAGRSGTLQQRTLQRARPAAAPQIGTDAVQARAVVGPATGAVARQDKSRWHSRLDRRQVSPDRW